MLIARRADTRARADFATWKMMAKLNGASSLTAEAQTFLASYRSLLGKMSEADATEATIQLMYKTYYAEMGGVGTPPAVRRDAGRAGRGQCDRVPQATAAPETGSRGAAGRHEAETAGDVDLHLPCAWSMSASAISGGEPLRFSIALSSGPTASPRQPQVCGR